MINQVKHYIQVFNEEKEMIKSSLILTVSNFIASFLTLVSNITIASIFGPQDFGIYRILVIAFGITVPSLIDLGGTLTLTKYVAEFQNDKKKIGHLNRQFLKIRFFTFLVSTLMILFLSRQVSSLLLHDPGYSKLIIPSLFILATSYFIIFHNITLGYENFKLYGFATVIGRLVYTVLIILVAYFTKNIYYSLFIYGFGFFVGYILCTKFLVRKNFLRIEKKINTFKIFLKYSLPMHAFYSINYLALSSVVILSPFFSTESMGYFSWAFQFYWASTFIAISISNMLLPKISRMNGQARKTKSVLKKVLFLYSPIAVAGVVGTFLFSKLFISFVAPDYLPGLIVFKIVMIYGFIAGYGLIYTSYFTAKGNTKKVAILQSVINILLIILGFVSLKLI